MIPELTFEAALESPELAVLRYEGRHLTAYENETIEALLAFADENTETA